ncbi:hypothetical protein AB0D71_39995 [Streptomyces avermitilis]|uniref:hypothetical protein n=1 Tax=Streptomyces avermitilis TaxID=33903 RepID=UPI0033C225E4
MNVNPPPPRSDGPYLTELILAFSAAAPAHSQAWASALGTAVAVYTVLRTGNRDNRS